ncbi:hypothetical protein ABPG72_013526 [Tetrahymena utriculariae]
MTYPLLLDTGSYVLWFASNQCQGCGKYYQNRQNCQPTDGCTQSQQEFTEIFTDGTTITGYLSQVDIMLEDRITIQNQQFLYATQGKDIVAGSEDDIFGLGTIDTQNKQNKYYNWVNILQNNYIISANQFSLYLDFTGINTQSSKSKLMLGSLDKQYIQPNSETSIFPVNSQLYWTIASTEISYDNAVISASNFNVLIDQGTSAMAFPKAMVDTIKNILFSQYNFNQENNIFYGQIGEKLPSFSFKFKDINDKSVTYTLEPEFYAIYLPDSNQIGVALREVEDLIILGDVFMMKYVSTFQYSPYLNIQLAQSITQPNSLPFKNCNKSFPLWAIIVIPIVGSLIFAVIVFYIYKRKQNQKLKAAQLEDSLKGSQHQLDNQQLQSIVQKKQDGSRFLQKNVSLINTSNKVYMMPIYVGNSKTQINAQLDTGSFVLWFASNQCQGCETYYPNRYFCQDTDGCILSKEEDTLSFGDGTTVTGYKVQVNVALGDGTKIQNQQFLYVNKGKDIVAGSEDGIFGLGIFDNYYTQNEQMNWVNIVYHNKLISVNQFSLYLDYTEMDTQSSKSMLMLGNLDVKYIQQNSDINIFPVSSKLEWIIASTEISYGSTVISSSTIDVLIDSGSSAMSLPKKMIDSIKNILINQYSMKFEKDINDKIMTYTQEPEFYLLYDPVDKQIGFGASEDESKIILGDVFMMKYVSTFQYTPNLQILLAQSFTQPNKIPFKNSNNNSSLPLWAKIFIPIVVYLTIAAFVFCLYKRRQNLRLKNVQNSQDLKLQLEQTNSQQTSQVIN